MGLTDEEQQLMETTAARLDAERIERVRRWAPYHLSEIKIGHPGQLADAQRMAKRSADILGMPVRIHTTFDGKVDVWEPQEAKLHAYGAYHRTPDWVKKEMGWD